MSDEDDSEKSGKLEIKQEKSAGFSGNEDGAAGSSASVTIMPSKPKNKNNQMKHVCDYCSREFRTKAFLEAHRMEVHMGVVVPKVQCVTCGTW